MHLFPALLVLAPPLTARTAWISILPPEPLPLGGYTERRGANFEPGGKDLRARVILLEQGATRVAIVSVDLLTIPESLAREVRRRLPEGTRLFLHATHTHSAPDSQMLNERMTFPIPGIATYRRRWRDWFAARIAGAVHQAEAAPASKVPPRLAMDVDTVAMNRGRRQGATPLKERRFFDLGVPVLTYAAHPTVLGADHRKTNGDWPAEVTARTGGLVLNGAIGDVSPVAEQGMEGIADELLRLRNPGAKSVPSVPLRFAQASVRLEAVHPHPEFARRYGVPEALAQTVVGGFAPKDASVTAVRIGGLVLVGIPGEPTSALGRAIESAGRKAGYGETIVVSNVNGWAGYLLEPADYDRGGYEATLSFHGRMAGPEMVHAANQALLMVKNPPRDGG